MTLFWGEKDAVLVDTLLSDAQNEELANWIESKNRKLHTIYLTHAHPDHIFGITLLLKRFPEAKAVAMPDVIGAMKKTISAEMIETNWNVLFPGLVPEELTMAQPLRDSKIELEGKELLVVEMGHTDTDDTTGLYVPSLDLLVAGDVVYNEAHPFLVETDAAGRREWLQALDKAEALTPMIVIVGHGPLDPDNSPTHIHATRRYIEDFDRIDRETKTARELYDRMIAIYPNRINPGSLWGSAHAAKNKL